MKRSLLSFVVTLVFCVIFGGVAKADTIGTLTLSDCGGGSGCPAATYSFDITSTSATLTITITGAVTSTNDFIGSVDLGFSPSGSISGLSLTTAPSSLSFWTTTTGSLSSNGNGCGSNSGAFVCSTALPSNPLSIVQGGVYTWTWTYNAIDPALIGASGVHVGAQYGPNSPNNTWNGLIISQVVSGPPVSVPEPGSLTLLGVGLLALAALARRHTQNG